MLEQAKARCAGLARFPAVAALCALSAAVNLAFALGFVRMVSATDVLLSLVAGAQEPPQTPLGVRWLDALRDACWLASLAVVAWQLRAERADRPQQTGTKTQLALGLAVLVAASALHVAANALHCYPLYEKAVMVALAACVALVAQVCLPALDGGMRGLARLLAGAFLALATDAAVCAALFGLVGIGAWACGAHASAEPVLAVGVAALPLFVCAWLPQAGRA